MQFVPIIFPTTLLRSGVLGGTSDVFGK